MEEHKIGVYICWCGSNIAQIVDVEAVSEKVRMIPGVIVSKDYKYMCSDPGQDMIVNDINKYGLNRIVIAACSPRMHEPTFRKVMMHAGLNPYRFEMVNIREQDSWVHTDKKQATEKAFFLIAGAIKRVVLHEELDKQYVDINPATLIIGAGIAGISAALEIADAGKQVFLIEKEDRIGGNLLYVDLTYPYFNSALQLLRDKIRVINNHKNIQVFLKAEVKKFSGYIGNFEAVISAENKKETSLSFGNVIIATGLKPFDPSPIKEYGYMKLPDVITSQEFEKMLQSGSITTGKGQKPENVAIIHCVGSRNKYYHEYCSRICCMVAIKFAFQLRKALPDADIFEIYSDLRAFGKGCEELYATACEKNIILLRFDQQHDLPVISQKHDDHDKMMISFHEKLSGEDIVIPADLVILMVALEGREDVLQLARLTGINICNNNFFIERHPKLDPVATNTEGIYIAGTCQSPKDIPDTINQAKATAARILASICVKKVEIEVTTAVVNENICCGCMTCVSVCPYHAISFDADKKVSCVNEVLCKGCGTCGAACPTGAIKCKHFTDKQIMAQIEGIINSEY